MESKGGFGFGATSLHDVHFSIWRTRFISNSLLRKIGLNLRVRSSGGLLSKVKSDACFGSRLLGKVFQNI